MFIQKKEIKECLDAVADIAAQYELASLDPDSTERSIDNLISACAAYLNKKIDKFELEITEEESPVLGCCIVIDDNHYAICYVQGLNYCWRRFVICKEVFHTVLDEVSYHNMSIDEHIDEVTVAFPDPTSKPSLSVASERLAEIAAMEFMFPYKRRAAELSRCGPDINYIELATKYKIPLVMVEKYLAEPYMTMLQKYSG